MNDKAKAYQEQLEELRQNFLKQVPARFSEIESCWHDIKKGNYDHDLLVKLYIAVHSLTGSSGTFGFKAIMDKAGKFDNWLKSLIKEDIQFTEEQKNQIDLLVTDLCSTKVSVSDANIFSTTQSQNNDTDSGQARVLIVDDDQDSANNLKHLFASRDYQVSVIFDCNKLLTEIENFSPHLILMDMVFPEGVHGGANAVEDMHYKGIDIPVVYITVRDDIETRLSAIRSGAYHYLTKPVDSEQLFSLANRLIVTRPAEPYRVLVVDDDQQLAEFYALILRNAGMTVTTLNDPMLILEVIRETQAELLLMDIYMPECNGIEAATVIRQIPEYNTIPIVFLSTEHRFDRQFIAMNHGGDDFLVKPVEPDHLVQSVSAKIERSRIQNESAIMLKKANKLLSYEKNRAEAASKSKSEFLCRMSHELRTPLNAILGFAQILEHRIKDGDLQQEEEFIKHILNAGWHLLDLINEVLDMSKIEAGQIELQHSAVDLQIIMADALDLVDTQAKAQQISIHNRLQDMSPLIVQADITRAKQVMLNILSNAVKYNKQNGSIIISADETPGSITLHITDTGVGMDSEQVQSLFEPFRRFDANCPEIEGTGLGLAISKRLIELMDGLIEVQSTPGQGSTFSVTLPKLTAAAATAQTGEILPEHGDDDSKDINSQADSNKSILYVEDNRANIKLVSMLINGSTGYDLHHAETGKEALGMLETLEPDLILLDINLPDIDGYKVLKSIRENTRFDKTPVIALTVNTADSDRQRAEATGFNDYLTKPINVKTFLDTINRVMLVD